METAFKGHGLDVTQAMSDEAKLLTIFGNKTMLFAFVKELCKQLEDARMRHSHECDHMVPYILKGVNVLRDIYGIQIG